MFGNNNEDPITLTLLVPILDQEKELTKIFIFTPLCGASKGFLWSPLKVVTATFLLVCLSSLKKKSTCETSENAFYFTSKALFVPEKIKF